ncbi:Putative molybdenum carrier [Ruegeria denitrificans]|uniref:Putative molybdenum carrier n=1 Tax=Ruegeria denitrificans TaxID=1715692 RepID=A0A0P1IFR9_9RHOB|nr:putative molybdenum carrier protein [Ruegeria denitrificans]CUJ91067.1 Putative molybdenum carrier [Ruegeria denitrificans]
MKIVSGGQTGVDMAALEFARQNGLPYGGWVPKGRMNEDGRIPSQFKSLTETASEDVAERTRCNVLSSDATLIFVDGSFSPGTQQTIVFANEAERPHLVIDVRMGIATSSARTREWLKANPVSVLNIAGPRASEAPQIGAQVREILDRNLDLIRA